MKSTGIIRRIDELGRIVIPKETRRLLRITEDTPMEIFMEDNKIVLQKYEAPHIRYIVNDLESAFHEAESGFEKETAGKIEEHIKALTEILKETTN